MFCEGSVHVWLRPGWVQLVGLILKLITEDCFRIFGQSGQFCCFDKIFRVFLLHISHALVCICIYDHVSSIWHVHICCTYLTILIMLSLVSHFVNLCEGSSTGLNCSQAWGWQSVGWPLSAYIARVADHEDDLVQVKNRAEVRILKMYRAPCQALVSLLISPWSASGQPLVRILILWSLLFFFPFFSSCLDLADKHIGQSWFAF